ncbi:MAG: histidinol, partial [Chitinophagaceae bacterium]
MKIINQPNPSDWQQLLKRPAFNNTELVAKVADVLQQVKLHGDTAVKKYTADFDGVSMENFLITQEAIESAAASIPASLKEAIQLAAQNIQLFHQQQVTSVEVIETMPGVQCWRKSVGIEKVGLYIPGGTAPLFSTILMLGIPASIAGCKEVILCSPPDKNGMLNSAILYAANLVGIKKIYSVGGVQAIAAMAYGTETI